MSSNKKLILPITLILVIVSLLAAQRAAAHEGNDCHNLPDLNHTIEEGEEICWSFQLGRTTRGRLVETIRATEIDVMITDIDGNVIVQGEQGEWEPIRVVDTSTLPWFPQDCPMPTAAVSRWEYSSGDLNLEPGTTYILWLTATLKHTDVSSLHMCGEPPAGPPSKEEPGTTGPLPAGFFTVVASD